MINTLVQHVVAALDDYMQSRTGVAQQHVTAASLLRHDGLPNESAKDRVVVNVVNIQADAACHSETTIPGGTDRMHAAWKPEVQVNVDLLFVGNFTQYSDALKSVSLVMAFFQSHPVIEYASIPDLGNRPHRVTVELGSPTFEQQNQLWGMLGAKYMPSVLYKARRITFADDAL